MVQERVRSQDEQVGDVVVQYNADSMTVGVGVEQNTDVPSRHFLSQIYGDAHTLADIGHNFYDRLSEFGYSNPNCSDFATSDAELQWFTDFGRAVLDSVEGSSSVIGYWSWLDRPGTNRLIRLLRKARDSAFGRDE